MPDAERPVMLHERTDVQRAIAHDGDDKELVRSVFDSGGTVQVFDPVAQQARADPEFHEASHVGSQRTSRVAVDIDDLLPDD